jgi:hypothetical protein
MFTITQCYFDLRTAILLTILGISFGYSQVQYAPVPKQLAGANQIISPGIQGTKLSQYTDAQYQQGTFIMRKQLANSQWGLFSGKLKNNAYVQLNGYSPDPRNPFVFFTQTRFFTDSISALNQVAQNEVQELYFDGHAMYSTVSALYYKNENQIESLAPIAGIPTILAIESTPSGASVYINGMLRGQTPLEDVSYEAGLTLIEIKTTGYYEVIDLQTTAQGKKQNLQYKLEALPTWDGVDPVLTRATQALPQKDVNECIAAIRAQKDQENTYLTKQTTPSGRRRFNLRNQAEMTPLPSKDQPQNPDSNANASQLGLTHTVLLERLQNQPYMQIIPISYANFGEYTLEHNALPVAIDYSSGLFDFRFHGKLSLPQDEALQLLNFLNTNSDTRTNTKKFSTRTRRLSGPQQLQTQHAQAWIVVHYNNLQTPARTMNKNVWRLYDLMYAELHIKGQVYRLQGNFTYPAYITQTKLWKELSNPLF